MIHIVTGGKNSGKTTQIKEIYATYGGDGFISDKIIKDGTFYGYQLTRLSTGESIPFIYENKYAPAHWKNIIKNVRFTFYTPAFDTAYHWINEIIRHEDFPIYIDEIGKLELDKKGFYAILVDIVNLNRDIYVAIRASYVTQFLEAFNITEYEKLNYKNIDKI